jgi:hypothetical protein
MGHLVSCFFSIKFIISKQLSVNNYQLKKYSNKKLIFKIGLVLTDNCLLIIDN